jgi:hypothetical protein
VADSSARRLRYFKPSHGIYHERMKEMPSRKKADTHNGRGRLLMIDVTDLPGGRIEEFRDRIKIARRKFDRLDAFSADLFETEMAGSEFQAPVGKKARNIDWDAERKKQVDVCDRLLRNTFALIKDLMELVHLARDDKELLKLFSIEQSTQDETRARRPKSHIRKLSR